MSHKAQSNVRECHVTIPVITFDSPEEEDLEAEVEGEATDSEDDLTLKKSTSQSEAIASERTTLESPDADEKRAGLQVNGGSTASLQLTNGNSSSGVDVRSQPNDEDPLDPGGDSQGFLRLPPTLACYGPGGRTHIRGLSMDSGKDAVLLSSCSHNTVCCQFCSHPVPICSSERPSVQPPTHTDRDVSLCQTTMTSSKSDLEAKEGQTPNESNFLEFVSLLGSLSTRAGGSSAAGDCEGPEGEEDAGATEEVESQQEGVFP